MNPGWG
ncbi:hypothetical protein AYI68_g7928, partial [Smittium mucronatum]